jgi:hypothetical protein
VDAEMSPDANDLGCAILLLSLDADYFRPAQYWLCEQDTDLITFPNG